MPNPTDSFPEPSKEYLEGEMRACAEDAEGEMPSAFANPYDEWDEPGKAYDFQCGYNNAMRNLKQKQAEEGSWYDMNDADWDWDGGHPQGQT